ncbi:hypothetical protein ACO2RV_18580 [Ancylobacter sp. VNQ12]|uniref:hypothetical protein n=1 Tax=Ancylobacter sp. VNQ12 TaxID=3400920 RepID=UPI003BFDB835
MNIRNQTDIDHAIAAAFDLHDLCAGQTGTAPAGRPSNPDRPSDNPPVEFAGEEDDRILSRLPFIAMTPRGRDFWAVEPTGAWAADCAIAAAHAATLVEEMHSRECNIFTGRVLLGWVLADIAAKGNRAHMVGFAGALSEALTRFDR